MHYHRGIREPNAAQISAFVPAVFPYADPDSYITMRVFYQGIRPDNARGLPYIVGVRADDLARVAQKAVLAARYAANQSVALLFAPPLATFATPNRARQIDLVNGVVLSVEIDDGDPPAILRRLQGLLGPATVIVASGGECVDPATGQVHDKIHAHWRLSEPTTEEPTHARLKYARRLATMIAASDPTAVPSVHPLRWPGSWHLKAAPRLTRIVALNQAAEIHLELAIEALETAVAGMPELALPMIKAVSGGDGKPLPVTMPAKPMPAPSVVVMPEAFMDDIDRTAARSSVASLYRDGIHYLEDAHRITIERIDAAIARVTSSIPHKNRHYTLNKNAFVIGGLIGGFNLKCAGFNEDDRRRLAITVDPIVELLLAALPGDGIDFNLAYRTASNGISDGELHPLDIEEEKPYQDLPLPKPDDPGAREFATDAMVTAITNIRGVNDKSRWGYVAITEAQMLAGLVAAGLLTEDTARRTLRKAIGDEWEATADAYFSFAMKYPNDLAVRRAVPVNDAPAAPAAPDVDQVEFAEAIIRLGKLPESEWLQQLPAEASRLRVRQNVLGDAVSRAQAARKAADQRLYDPWRELPLPPAFPLDVLPPVLRTFAEDRAHYMGVDPSGIAWASLSACSVAIHGNIRLRMKQHDDWRIRPALWVALIGCVSTLKSPIIDVAWSPLEKFQAKDIENRATAMRKWESLPDKDKKVTPKPVCRRLVSHSATTESLQDILKDQSRGIGVKRDELAGWIGGMDKYGGKGDDRAFWLQSYNGGAQAVDRVKRGAMFSQNVLTGICGGIQLDRLVQLKDLEVDGLLQRFIPIIVTEEQLGQDEPNSGSAGANFERLIHRLLTLDDKLQLRLSAEAHVIRRDVEVRLQPFIHGNFLGDHFKGFCGKLHGLFGRFCIILHLARMLSTDKAPQPADLFDQHMLEVGGDTAEAARTLIVDSVLPNAALVYAALGGAGGDIEATRNVAGFVLRKRSRKLLASELSRDVRVCRGKTLQQVQAIVSPLVAGGWLDPVDARYDRTTKEWWVDARVHAQFTEQRKQEEARIEAIRGLLPGRTSRP